MARINRLALATAAAAAGAGLSGCVPIPLAAGYQDASRQNVPGAVPDFIVQGASSRADVLLALGEPDRSADDESWFLYGSIYSKGGLMLVGAIGGPYSAALVGVGQETMRYRLLTVRFDAAGTVSDVELTQKMCSEWLGGVAGTGSSGSSGRSDPCVDVSGDTQIAADRVGRVAHGETIVATYPRVLWWEGQARPLDVPFGTPPVQERVLWGSVAITERTLLLVAAPSAPPAAWQEVATPCARDGALMLPLASVAKASADRRFLLLPYVTLTMQDGSHAAFIVLRATEGYDSDATQAAAAIITEKIKALSHEQPSTPPPP